MLAVINTVHKLISILLGNLFVQYLNHKLLVNIFEKNSCTSKRIDNWILAQKYDFEVKDMPGKDNSLSDMLSRLQMNVVAVQTEQGLENRTQDKRKSFAEELDLGTLSMPCCFIGFLFLQLVSASDCIQFVFRLSVCLCHCCKAFSRHQVSAYLVCCRCR